MNLENRRSAQTARPIVIGHEVGAGKDHTDRLAAIAVRRETIIACDLDKSDPVVLLSFAELALDHTNPEHL